MNKFIIPLLFLVSSIDVLACIAPRSGEKYNALLKVEKANESDIFKFEVPKNIANHKFDAEVYLSFFTQHKKGYWVREKSELIETKNIEGILSGDLMIPPKKGYKISLTVHWPANAPGLCATFANSRVLYDGTKT